MDDPPSSIEMLRQYDIEQCELAIEASHKLAELPQHPLTSTFWRNTEALWRQRLRNLEIIAAKQDGNA